SPTTRRGRGRSAPVDRQGSLEPAHEPGAAGNASQPADELASVVVADRNQRTRITLRPIRTGVRTRAALASCLSWASNQHVRGLATWVRRRQRAASPWLPPGLEAGPLLKRSSQTKAS